MRDDSIRLSFYRKITKIPQVLRDELFAKSFYKTNEPAKFKATLAELFLILSQAISSFHIEIPESSVGVEGLFFTKKKCFESSEDKFSIKQV